RRPFESHEVLEILYRHAHEIPPAPSTLRPDVPLQLERLVLAMLEKKPDRRPTVPVIEERLADLRDQVLRPMGDGGPIPLRAPEVVPHRVAKHDAARPAMSPMAPAAPPTTPSHEPAKASGNRDYMIDPFAAPKK